ncbi:MaoC family dehydratase [Mesorhizobium sp. YM1C-6-2]|uniref:MaoC family dehydratase n=1 Tax=Mesorhizobium sp. YM1C-6-2 TaxID=1827501 RepID=UPI000EF1F0C2|nr:MaoC family dehydratase [Mesorhizobium sp. YM1C-6-2]RLP24386.1 MaoC family dehydratase [Mesorhizobium sp. YM1C-6-2]
MSRPGLTFEALRALVGQELGVSNWITVDQEKIDQFADCTGDRQWIHVDPERARKESPFRKPIAHGYLTLSLVSAMMLDIDMAPENTQAAFVHGLDSVRFIAPVRSGARVRMHCTLVSMEDRGPGQYLARCANVVEVEGDERPALTAEVLIVFYERRKRQQV